MSLVFLKTFEGFSLLCLNSPLKNSKVLEMSYNVPSPQYLVDVLGSHKDEISRFMGIYKKASIAWLVVKIVVFCFAAYTLFMKNREIRTMDEKTLQKDDFIFKVNWGEGGLVWKLIEGALGIVWAIIIFIGSPFLTKLALAVATSQMARI